VSVVAGAPDGAAQPVVVAQAPLLAAAGLTVAIGGKPIIRDVDLAIAAGDRIALVGPNGAGKSTLLRALTGMVAPSAGTVTLHGAPLASVERRTVARTLAVVPELQELPFGMPVTDVVALGRLPHEPPLTHLRPSDRAAVDAAIERVGITHLRERDVRVLSMGERQLVFIALALAQEAPILILDEPTVHLDIRHQVEVMRLLVDLNERGTTVIAVLHDLAFAGHFFPRVAMLAGGRLVADGSAAATLDDDRIRTVFGVDPGLVRLSASSPGGAGTAGGARSASGARTARRSASDAPLQSDLAAHDEPSVAERT
jgi:iron complex transport system ATP-binding protein